MGFSGLTVSRPTDPGRGTAPEFIQGKCYRSAQKVPYLEVMEYRNIHYIHFWIKKPSTIDIGLPLTHFIDYIPNNAKRIPISIEVGLSGRAPKQSRERAQKMTIDRHRPIITTSTSSFILRKHNHKLEQIQGLGKMRKLRRVGRFEVA